MQSPTPHVFYDASGRRRRNIRLATLVFGLLLALSGVIFIASIFDVQPQPLLAFDVEHPSRHAEAARAAGDARMTKRLAALYKQSASLMKPLFAPHPTAPLNIAFHAPWDDSSAASLSRHISDLDWLVPAWMSLTGPAHTLTEVPDARGRSIINSAQHRPRLMPMIQNAIEGNWDGKGFAALVADPAARRRALDEIEARLVADHAEGAFFDFEELPAKAHGSYLRFLGEARQRFAQHGWPLAIAAPVGDREWDLAAYAAIVDKVFLMAYDEHSEAGDPGPIASTRWFTAEVTRAVASIPPAERDKIVVAIGNYAYDWVGKTEVDPSSIEDEWLSAKESEALPAFDPESGNSHYQFEENGVQHEVWMLDAAAAYIQLRELRSMGLNDIALWRLGTEDPSLWKLFGRGVNRPLSPHAIEAIPAGTNVDIEGNGEILKIVSTPVAGERRVSTDRSGRELANVEFTRLPTPYRIERTGAKPGLVALTFDDGPDPRWTPQILDILKANSVPATFFVVGENALTELDLLNREVTEGHEVGSHTYTHPNLATAPEAQTELELNATQRLFQAYTGHSMRLFRAPFFGDAEPTTADELGPIHRAQQLGYLSIGLHVDPGDWKRPGTDAIVQRTVQAVTSASKDFSENIILLHDSGGDRSQTVAALPQIIQQLQAKGYRFVRVSELAGLGQAAAMPPISGADRIQARFDLYLFYSLGWIVIGLGWLFTTAISVGIARAVILSGLALRQARQEARQVFPEPDPERLVSVLIPAFNEADVIERSIMRVLESTSVRIEVIVIDDGSTDGTSEVVRRAFGSEPRVRLLTLPNGGKARALNQGLSLASGEIVVALDADTQFEPATIARLARWFVDPQLGAVAGNAKVGNRVNLVTRWQALEYVTAQNLERRALASLDAMTVVPGAVGAWRLATLRAVGGYPVDTLAEDQDLTIAIQRAGWKVHYDQFAVAWTEAPESFRGFAKQRFRWAYGTLQCLWKHRAIMRTGRPRGLAFVGLPQVFLFQILFAAISPIIDLALVVSIVATGLKILQHGFEATSTDIDKMLVYWTVFTAVDLLAGLIAFILERQEKWRLLWLLVPQRFVYRQVMYWVVIKALSRAAQGLSVGWGKLKRTGRVGEIGG
jgi:cellulose synthase/poly-beta-1,6-N-acetylglucosamine synthase-like glycosyltransferase/peptidoglycan/xylan/chitin deacetylase (PgdA/CDA1 family)/spore germination protein YaaH